ncbi:IPExxxVDY family protein [Tenacibaculum sp. MEBiC06402]|uniref:IPExxxVDY family protein n=1 Tax=unclassified Tenacibaculum TaxID=2635139 RepID=UPI003B9C598C
MQVHTVSLDDFSCTDYHIIGIHSTLEDYQLAYVLNANLNVHFQRCKTDIDVKNKSYEAFYPLFEYMDYNNDDVWYLISNVFKTKAKDDSNSLFAENETRRYLIPEKKKVDYFLKLEGEFTQNKVHEINEVIHQTQGVITSYNIDTNTLKSKEFLIF